MNFRRLSTFFLFFVGAVLSLAAGLRAEDQPPLLLGAQAYTFRRFTFAETLDKLEGMGIRYVQAYPGQDLGGGLPGKFNYTMDEATRAAVRGLIKSKQIEVVSYGVITGKDEAEWRNIFAFARAMGLQNVTSEPPQEVMPLIDRLSREFGITVALHNHPTPNRYANPATALAAIQPYGANLGLCADTGHWVRSGYDPVASLRLAAGHILYVHFKDLDERGVNSAHDVPWGTGVSDAAGQILELRRQRFSGVVFIEYEHDTPSLDSEVARSAAFFRNAAVAADADLTAGRVVPLGYTRDPVKLWGGDRGKGGPRWAAAQALVRADLANAKLPSGDWAWREGILGTRKSGELWTKESYGDFALSLELRGREPYQGAILCRWDGPPTAPPNGFAVPIVSSDRPADSPPGGIVFNLVPPAKRIALKPGEWTQLVITAAGGHFSVALGHKEIVKINLDDPKTLPRNPEGTAFKPTPAFLDLSRDGHIGLLDQGASIEFRNILIERL